MSQARVLVADPNPAFLEKTGQIVREMGHLVLTVGEGPRVLSACRQQVPDLVVVHEKVPGIAGPELCRELRALLGDTVPLVLMMDPERAQADEVARRAGADNFVIRPLKRTELEFCVRAMLRLRRALAAQAPPSPLASRPGMVLPEVFDAFVDVELHRVDRYGFPLSLLVVALDPLPEATGAWAEALSRQLGPALADSIRSTLREIDISTPLADQSFQVLMPHTDRNGARIVAHRVCDSVAARSYHFGRSRIQPTVSIGAACVHGERLGRTELIARARSLRERACAAGGNRVAVG